MLRVVLWCALACVSLPSVAEENAEPTARELVAGALDLMRGTTSYAEMEMVIHRPDWERRSRLVAWTRGREDALIRFTAPARDAGNATLKRGDNMWTFTPKLNRTVRLPFSLMAQSWAGSDFSYNDLARSDKLLEHYDLSLVDAADREGHRVYTVAAVPRENAPVVWGKEVLELRGDYVLLRHTFFDQNMQALKRMTTLEIDERDGRIMPTRLRMLQLDEPERYTEVRYRTVEFGVSLDDELFTLFALRTGASP
ncbi:MAG: outer membrane lipoprotein-sorting protein [Pseudomonadota bacterium]